MIKTKKEIRKLKAIFQKNNVKLLTLYIDILVIIIYIYIFKFENNQNCNC